MHQIVLKCTIVVENRRRKSTTLQKYRGRLCMHWKYFINLIKSICFYEHWITKSVNTRNIQKKISWEDSVILKVFGTPRKVIISLVEHCVVTSEVYQNSTKNTTSLDFWLFLGIWITRKTYNLVVKTISVLCKGNLDSKVWDFPHHFLKADTFSSAINQLKFYNPDVLDEFQHKHWRTLTAEDTGVDLKKRVERNDPCLLTLLCKTNVCL